MRGDDDIVHGEQRIPRIDRFLFEYVQRGAGDAARAQCLDECGLVDDGTAGDVDEVGGRLHLRELACAHQMAGPLVEQAGDDYEVGFGEQGGEIDLARAEVGELERVHDRVGGEQLEIERSRHAHDFLTDSSGADHTERTPGQPQAHVVHPFVPAAAAGEL